MKRRRGVGALRELSAILASFCCFMLLLTSVVRTAEGATVNIAGTWNVTGSESWTCLTANGMVTYSGTMVIAQSGTSFQIAYQLVDDNGETSQGTTNGTINSSNNGQFSETLFVEREFVATITGFVSGDTLSLQFSDQSSGECHSSGSFSGTRQTVVSDTVIITATDATATEAGPTTGTFTVTRSGSTAASLTVFYSVSGSATPDSDYFTPPRSIRQRDHSGGISLRDHYGHPD